MRVQIKAVADWMWSKLSEGLAADKRHQQSLYSFMTSRHLDCFGLGMVTVATCHAIGLLSVHLVLGEDHCWSVLSCAVQCCATGAGNDVPRTHAPWHLQDWVSGWRG